MKNLPGFIVKLRRKKSKRVDEGSTHTAVSYVVFHIRKG